MAWESAGIVVVWVSRVARTGDAADARGLGGREVVGLPIVAEVGEIVRFGIVVRRFAGGLVRIRSSVPTHAYALPRARSTPPQAGRCPQQFLVIGMVNARRAEISH